MDRTGGGAEGRGCGVTQGSTCRPGQQEIPRSPPGRRLLNMVPGHHGDGLTWPSPRAALC